MSATQRDLASGTMAACPSGDATGRAKRDATAASERNKPKPRMAVRPTARGRPCDPESRLSEFRTLVEELAPKVETSEGYDPGTSRFQQSRCGRQGGKPEQEDSEREAKGKRGWLW